MKEDDLYFGDDSHKSLFDVKNNSCWNVELIIIDFELI